MRKRKKPLVIVGLIILLLAVPASMLIIKWRQKYVGQAEVSVGPYDVCELAVGEPREEYDPESGTYSISWEMKNKAFDDSDLDETIVVKAKKEWCRCQEGNGNPPGICLGDWPNSEGACRSEEETFNLRPREEITRTLTVSTPENVADKNCGSFQVDYSILDVRFVWDQPRVWCQRHLYTWGVWLTGRDSNGQDCQIKPEKHTICQDKACLEVEGEGENQCQEASDCTQNVCQNNACVEIAGTGEDQCQTDQDCLTPTHKVCQDQACVVGEGEGTNECETNNDCVTPSHNICQDEACVQVSGEGTNECNTNADCQEETHKECQNNACAEVAGAGRDECQSDADCAAETRLICRDEACVEVEGSGSDECTKDADCQEEEIAQKEEEKPKKEVPITGIDTPAVFTFMTAGLVFLIGLLLFF